MSSGDLETVVVWYMEHEQSVTSMADLVVQVGLEVQEEE
jgi:hypothetical protein